MVSLDIRNFTGGKMLDIDLIRNKADLVRKALEKRNDDTAIVDEMLELDKQYRTLLSEVELLRAERNRVSKEIGRSINPLLSANEVPGMGRRAMPMRCQRPLAWSLIHRPT